MNRRITAALLAVAVGAGQLLAGCSNNPKTIEQMSGQSCAQLARAKDRLREDWGGDTAGSIGAIGGLAGAAFLPVIGVAAIAAVGMEAGRQQERIAIAKAWDKAGCPPDPTFIAPEDESFAEYLGASPEPKEE